MKRSAKGDWRPQARHPQYAGFLGFFLQWPMLVTGLMLPVLLVMYWRLARREEDEGRDGLWR
jgi:protein-S-isoprenylcysteine O-methyltransferase Ste14